MPSRMNGLNLKTSTKAAAGPISTVTNLGSFGGKYVQPLKPSNDPGPMTAPSGQGPSRPGTKQRTGNAGDKG